MGNTCLFVNPKKEEFLDPSYLGEGFQKRSVLKDPYTQHVIISLISDYSSGANDSSVSKNKIVSRWVGDPVVLAWGQGSSENLHDRAEENFTNISYLALADLCSNETILEEMIIKAKQDDTFFIYFINSLSLYHPDLMRDSIVTESLIGWKKRYAEVTKNRHWHRMNVIKTE